MSKPAKTSFLKRRPALWLGLLGLAVFLIVGGIALFTVSGGPDLRPLEQPLQKAGYQLYNPPRANWGPGFVFAGDVTDNRVSNVEEVCPNLYSDSEPQPGTLIAMPEYSAKDDFSFNLSMKFLKNRIGPELDTGRVERERTADIKWRNVREFSYTHADQWLASGEARPVEKRCRSAIEDLKAKDRFKDRLFIIIRAVAPESLVYDFGRAAKVEGAGKLAKELRVSAEGKAQITNDTRLEINDRLFVGYAPPVKIVDWVPTGLVSGEVVKVRGSSSNVMIR